MRDADGRDGRRRAEDPALEDARLRLGELAVRLAVHEQRVVEVEALGRVDEITQLAPRGPAGPSRKRSSPTSLNSQSCRTTTCPAQSTIPYE